MSEPIVDRQALALGERAYYLVHFDKRGDVTSAEVISADSDTQASAIAQTMQNGGGLELWERTRLLARYPHCAATSA